MRYRAPFLVVAVVSLSIGAATLVGVALSHASTPPFSALWMGDSYSSGWGQPGETTTCQQSPEAWPRVATSLLQGTDVDVTNPTYVACGGDTTAKVDEEAAGTNPADLVGFTFGGDDVGFSGILTNCVIGDTGTKVGGVPDSCPSDASVRQDITDSLASQWGGYEGFLNHVASKYVNPGGNILVLGYPALIEEESRWDWIDQRVGLCNGLSPQTAYLMRGWAGLLNQEIGEGVALFDAQSASARKSRWATFVNVQDGGSSSDTNSLLFDPADTTVGHNLCGSSPWITSWTNFDKIHLGWPPATATGFHPTVSGSAAMGALAANAIEGMNWSNLPSPQNTSTPPQGPSGGSQSPPTGTVSLEQGALYGGSEYWYDVTLSGWAPAQSVSITCFDSQDPQGFRSFTATTDASGNAQIDNECRSGTGPTYWVTANGIASNSVQWGYGSGSPPATTTTTTTAPTTTTTTAPRSTTSTTAPPEEVEFYNNYGPYTTDVTNCTGGTSSDSDPGGTDSQTFTIPSNVVSLDHIVFEADDGTGSNSGVETTATLDDNGSQVWSGAVHPNDDTTMSFGSVNVTSNSIATLTFHWSSTTSGHVDSIYTAGTVYGTFTATNSCSFANEVPGEFDSNLTTGTSSLRAQIYGWTN